MPFLLLFILSETRRQELVLQQVAKLAEQESLKGNMYKARKGLLLPLEVLQVWPSTRGQIVCFLQAVSPRGPDGAKGLDLK